jgi:hypothetical protein
VKAAVLELPAATALGPEEIKNGMAAVAVWNYFGVTPLDDGSVELVVTEVVEGTITVGPHNQGGKGYLLITPPDQDSHPSPPHVFNLKENSPVYFRDEKKWAIPTISVYGITIVESAPSKTELSLVA